MKAKNRVLLAVAISLGLVIMMSFGGARPISIAQGPDNGPQLTPQPGILKATPTPPLELKRELENRVLQVASSAPPNDDFDSATLITSYPFTDVLDTTGATVASDDPNMGCGAGVNSNTVWYRLEVSTHSRVEVNTFGSNYDTVLAVFTGARGALTRVACNDDTSGLQSQLSFSAAPGTVYHIEVADFGSPGGGILQLYVASRALPQIDVPLDLLLLQDETGSMDDDIGTLRSLAPEIWDNISVMARAGFRMGIAGFRDYARSPWGDSGDWVYRLLQDLTDSRDSYMMAVNALTAGGGNDGPESQYAALYYLLAPSHPCIDSNGDGDCTDSNDTPIGRQPTFRSGAKRVILLATDAPFHAPEDTPGYPGPTRDTVINALRAFNVTVIGLVPGGEGRIPEVDDLALATGGSVHNTGASGEEIAIAIAEALGEFQSRPGSPGSLFLSLPYQYSTAQPIALTVRVDNLTGIDNTYTVTLSLLQDGTTLTTQSRGMTVPGGGNRTEGFNFGTWLAGSYRLRAELRLGDTLLDSQTADITVLDSGAQRVAEEYAGKLKTAAGDELEEMADMALRTLAEDIVSFGLDVAQAKLLSEFDNLTKPIREAGGIPPSASDGAMAQIRYYLGQISAKRQNIAVAVRLYARDLYGVQLPDGFDPLNTPLDFISDVTLKEAIERLIVNVIVDIAKPRTVGPWWIAPQMQAISSRDAQFRSHVATQAFTWSPALEEPFDRGQMCIGNIVESDSLFSLGPYDLLGTTLQYDVTLQEARNKHDLLKQVGDWLKIVVAALAVIGLVILVFLFIGAITSLPPLVLAIAGILWKIVSALLTVLTKGKALLTIALFALSVGMLFSVSMLAPHVTDEHDNTLDAVEALISSTGHALAVREFSVAPAQRGQPVKVSASIESRETARTVAPLVETVVYSVDGRALRCLWAHPTLASGQTALLEREIILPAGSYRAVSTIHTGEQVAIAVQSQTFAVSNPELQLALSLNKALFAPGEAVHAAVSITNTNPISDVNDLTLLVESSDGQNFKAWPLSLGPGGTRQVEYVFVPSAEGGYVLRATLTVGLNELAIQDAAYVVGTGASLALNVGSQDVYDPAIAVTIPITASNAGNLPTSTVLSLVTLDRLADLTAVYTDTLSLNVDAGASMTTTVTALPAALAQPGLYTARLFLGDDLYTSLDFAVAAEGTLFADIYPNNVLPAVGDVVTLTVQVMNSVYAYTDALVDVTVWRPDGITQTVTMNSISTGQYQGTVTAPITGTYLATVDVSKPNYRAVGNSTFFVAGQRSQLLPTVDGRPILGTTQLVTVTVRNEQGVPIVGASLTISGTLEHLSRQTDEAGRAVLQLSPTITESYQISLEKLGFATTLMDLPVWIAPDVTPPPLFLDTPSITNQTPITVTGLTEAGAAVTVNSQAMVVDAQGRFTTTVTLYEGNNVLDAIAADMVGNSTTVSRTVTLDTVPPTLTVTYPPEGLVTAHEVISVTGITEVGASIMVSGTLGMVDPASGAFSTWVLLQPGLNAVPIVAQDAAGNVTTITVTVTYSRPLQRRYLPLILRR